MAKSKSKMPTNAVMSDGTTRSSKPSTPRKTPNIAPPGGGAPGLLGLVAQAASRANAPGASATTKPSARRPSTQLKIGQRPQLGARTKAAMRR